MTILLFFLQSNYPLLERFYKAYMEIPAVQVAVPEKQPDAPSPWI
jgi:maleylacetoacetate isomerase